MLLISLSSVHYKTNFHHTAMTDEIRDLDTPDLEALDEDTAQSIRGGESWAYEAGHALGEAIEAGLEALGEAASRTTIAPAAP